MSRPFAVATVIPARNGMPDVLESVESALRQTAPPDEVVVVDDGSSDGTGDAVERRFGSRVRVLRGRFGSAAAARNAGWRATGAPWVAFLDADDLWFPDKLAVARERLLAEPAAAWFFSDGAFRTLDGELQASWFRTYAEVDDPYYGQPTAELIEVNFILTSSVVVRRDLLEHTGGFDERMSHAEDLDLWIRLSRGWLAAGAARPLVRYQHRHGGLTRQVEARLTGDVDLFRRLGADRSLEPGLRRAARRREALAHYKLAVEALREGRQAEARVHVARAWFFPERGFAVAAAWAACHVPRAWLGGVRGQTWATRGVAAPMARPRRVVLRSAPRRPAAPHSAPADEADAVGAAGGRLP